MRYVLVAVAMLALVVGAWAADQTRGPSSAEVPAIEMLDAEPNERKDGLGAAAKRGEEEGAEKRRGSGRDDAEPALLAVGGGATPAPAPPAPAGDSDDRQGDEDDRENGED